MASMPRDALLALPNNKTKINGSPTVSVERNPSTRQQERADHLVERSERKHGKLKLSRFLQYRAFV
jgi:hypothetical protein